MPDQIRLILVIAVCALCTMLTRALPFLVFRDPDKVPKIVLYLGKVLPPAVIAGKQTRHTMLETRHKIPFLFLCEINEKH